MSIILYESEDKYIYILKRRGLKIDDNKVLDIKEILYKEGYNSLIKNYEYIFFESDVSLRFRNDITFYSIKALYDFDKNIKNIYFKYISIIEHQLKSVISHTFILFHNNRDYLKLENYEINDKNCFIDSFKAKKVLELIVRLESTLLFKIGKDERITDLFVEYGYVPFENFINHLTLGEISTFYSLMKTDEQILVSKKFKSQNYDLILYLKNLTNARNLCAHDEVFFNYQYKNYLKIGNIKGIEKLKIPFDKGNFNYGISDAFSILLIIFLLLDKDTGIEFINLIDEEFIKMNREIPDDILNKIKLSMGFNKYWKNIIHLK